MAVLQCEALKVVECEDTLPVDSLGSEAALQFTLPLLLQTELRLPVKSVHTHKVLLSVPTTQISSRALHRALPGLLLHPLPQRSLLATQTVELVPQYTQHPGTVAHHDGLHPRPGEAVDHTARHRLLRQVVLRDQVDGGEAEGGLQNTEGVGEGEEAGDDD